MAQQVRWLTVAGALAVSLVLPLAAAGQGNPEPLGFKFNTGQSVQPIFEGWARNPDGTFSNLDVPGAIRTQPEASNFEGSVAGEYTNPGPFAQHGFLLPPDSPQVGANGSRRSFATAAYGTPRPPIQR